MTEAKFPWESTFLCACFRFKRPPAVLSVLSCPLHYVCRVDAEEDVQDFRQLRPGLDPPPVVVLFLCAERALHRCRPHTGKFISDKILVLSHRMEQKQQIIVLDMLLYLQFIQIQLPSACWRNSCYSVIFTSLNSGCIISPR